jgi:hypothetical protein
MGALTPVDKGKNGPSQKHREHDDTQIKIDSFVQAVASISPARGSPADFQPQGGSPWVQSPECFRTSSLPGAKAARK